jgi:hypothetical protein
MPYRGGAPAITDLLSQQVQVYFANIAEARPALVIRWTLNGAGSGSGCSFICGDASPSWTEQTLARENESGSDCRTVPHPASEQIANKG